MLGRGVRRTHVLGWFGGFFIERLDSEKAVWALNLTCGAGISPSAGRILLVRKAVSASSLSCSRNRSSALGLPPNTTVISCQVALYLKREGKGQVCGRSSREPTPKIASIIGAGWSAREQACEYLRVPR